MHADLEHRLAEAFVKDRGERAKKRREQGSREIGGENEAPHARHRQRFRRLNSASSGKITVIVVSVNNCWRARITMRKPDGIAKARHQAAPMATSGSARVKKGLSKQGKADREAASKSGPPERDGRALHLLLAFLPDDLVDGLDGKPRVLLDRPFLALGDLLLGCVQHVANFHRNPGGKRAGASSVARQAGLLDGDTGGSGSQTGRATSATNISTLDSQGRVQAARMSVREKSSPLNNKGSPVRFASA